KRMATPNPEGRARPGAGLSRRDFFQWVIGGAAAAAATPLPDLLARMAEPLPVGEVLGDDGLYLSVDLVGFLRRAEEEEERRPRPGYGARPVPPPACPLGQFLDRAEEIFRAAPDLCELYVDNTSGQPIGHRPDIERLAASPYLGRLTTLDLNGCN